MIGFLAFLALLTTATEVLRRPQLNDFRSLFAASEMVSFLTIYFLLWLSHSVHAYRQPSDYIWAFKDFGNSYLAPANLKYSREIAAPFFSDNIIGRVDISTNFLGAELNTEYIYGMFAVMANDSDVASLLGSPVSNTVQSLSVEPPIVAASVITNFSYPDIDFLLPVQLDFWVRFDDNLKITSYDVTFRRWAEAWSYLMPKLLPTIAAQSGQTLNSTTNQTALIATFVAQQICRVSTQYCTGSNQQYNSNEACVKYLTETVPLGSPWEAGLDTVICRYLHKNMVPFRPQVHCPHIGPTGGDMCVARDYLDIVMGYPFSETLNAPNASWTKEDVAGLSDDVLNQLVDVYTQTIVPITVAWYSVPPFLFFLLLFGSAKMVEFAFKRCFSYYAILSWENKHISIMYVLNVFYTTAALGVQLAASPSLAQRYSLANVSELRIVAAIVSGLYLFELSYRHSMRLPLILHHICTLFAIILLFISLQMTNHPSYIILGDIWLFQATTEQSVFIALLLYRFRYSKNLVRWALQFSAIQSFIFKFAFAAYLFVEWIDKHARKHTHKIDIAFSVLFCIILVLIMGTQVYGSLVVWLISRSLDKRYRKTSGVEESGASTLIPLPKEGGHLEPFSDDVRRDVSRITPVSRSTSKTQSV